MSTTKKPDAADVHIGRSVKRRRTSVGLSQEQLAERLGITFQQIQKYEKGANRIGAGRLYGIARALSTPVAAFYEGLDEEATAPTGMAEADRQAPLLNEPPSDVVRLASDFQHIVDPNVRQGVLDLVSALATKGTGSVARAPAPRARSRRST